MITILVCRWTVRSPLLPLEAVVTAVFSARVSWGAEDFVVRFVVGQASSR